MADLTAEFDMRNVARTQALGERLGQVATPGALILLSGGLGSGKTALTQGIGRGLSIGETVNSPTFTILKEHHGGRLALYHFDLYRVVEAEEIWSLGFIDYFSGSGLSVVEWAERLSEEEWGDDWLWLSFTVTGTSTRHISARARGNRGSTLFTALES